MKIAALQHTELIKDPSKQPFSVDLPASAVFRGALLALGPPSMFQKWRRDLSKLDIQSQERAVAQLPVVVGELLSGVKGMFYPTVIMSFSYNPDAMAIIRTRWYHMVASPVDFPDVGVANDVLAPIFLAQLWEQRPAHNGAVMPPSPMLLYEVGAPR